MFYYVSIHSFVVAVALHEYTNNLLLWSMSLATWGVLSWGLPYLENSIMNILVCV